MKYLRELIEAMVLAAIIGGPFFYYLLYVMKP
jgi:ABC-type Fe3+-siderophore transport system permease subunit